MSYPVAVIDCGPPTFGLDPIPVYKQKIPSTFSFFSVHFLLLSSQHSLMRFFKTIVATLIATCAVVQAAPLSVYKAEVFDLNAQQASGLAKRQDLANALLELQELQELKVKRDEVEGELSEREYAIVTEVLTLVKDTDLTPTILKAFVLNSVLKSLAITGIELVIKLKIISLNQLVNLLVKSGLITSVASDLIGNCEVYVGILNVAKSLLGSLIKRDEIPESHTAEQGMLRRDSFLTPLPTNEAFEKEKRDLDDVIVNVLESLANSGLASQVVETILTDSDFLVFGAQLLAALYATGELNISGIISATLSSGLLPQLLQKFLNASTLSEIVSTGLDALDGKCSGSSTSGNSTDTGSGTGNSTGGTLILDILGSLTGGSSSNSSASSSSSSSLGLISSLLGGLLGLGSSSSDSSGSDSSSSGSSGSSLISSLLDGLNITSGSSSSASASSSSSSGASLIGDLLSGLDGSSSATPSSGTTTTSTADAPAASGSDTLSKILATIESSSESSASSSSSSSTILTIASSLLGSLLGKSGESSTTTSNPCEASGVAKRDRLLLL